MSRSQLVALGLIIIAACFIRWKYNTETQIDKPIRADAAYYIIYAKNLINHQTFSKDQNSTHPVADSFWAPGYPAFLAITMKFADAAGLDIYKTILASQVALGTLSVLFTFLIAYQFLPVIWSLFATLLTALSPHLIAMGSYVLTETLFCTLITLSILLFVYADKNRSLLLYFFCGVALAATWLVNPVTLLCAPIFFAISHLQTRGAGQQETACQWRVLAALIGPVAFAVLAWTFRGWFSVPENAPDSGSRLLTNLIIGMHSDFYDIWRADPRDPNNPATISSTLIQGSYLNFLSEWWRMFTDAPLKMTYWYTVQKPLLLWDWNIRVGQGDIYVYPVIYSLYNTSKIALLSYVAISAIHFWLLGFALAGVIIAQVEPIKTKVGPLAITGLLVYLSLVYIATQAEPRYSIPLRPIMYLCATYAMARLTIIFKPVLGARP